MVQDLILMVIIDIKILNQDFDNSIIYYLNLLFKTKNILKKYFDV